MYLIKLSVDFFPLSVSVYYWLTTNLNEIRVKFYKYSVKNNLLILQKTGMQL
jgi:hypothetical protein